MPHILVVDDEEAYRNLLCGHLERKGFAVSTAQHGREALELLKEDNSFSVLVTDLMMPEMTGLELLRAARELDPWLEVIVITASDDVDNAISAMREDGAYDYLLKPLETIGLVSLAVGRAIQHRSLRLDRETLNERLSEQAGRLNALISGTGDAMIAADGNGTISVANPAAEAMLRTEDLAGKRALDVLPDALVSLVENWIDLGERLPTVVEINWPSDSVQSVSLTPIQQDGDGWVMVCRDITHLRNLDELKMRTMNEAASRFRLPLAQAVSKLARLGELDSGESEDVSATIYQLAKLLGRIQTWMDELLALVRVDAGIGYTSERVDIYEVLDERWVTNFESAHHDRDLKLSLGMDKDLPALNVDPSMLAKMLQGLIGRAAIRSTRGGTVRLTACQRQGQLWIEVTDQGFGNGRAAPSPEDSLPADTTQVVGGEGFGLELVKAIVGRMGGQLWVRGHGAVGSTIAISLPAGEGILETGKA
jgi:PAS domain S-box-containing protein